MRSIVTDNTLVTTEETKATALAVSLRYDYSQIDEGEREATIRAAIEIKGHTRNTTERILKMGKLLLERKAALPSGTFQKWIEAEGDVSYRNAAHFMNVYTRFGDKSETVSLFGPSSLFLLSGPSVSDEVVEGIVEEAKKTGEKPTKAKVKATLAEHRPGPRTLTVVECEAVITRALEKAASDPVGQHQALLRHIDPDDYVQAINGDNVTMRRKEFNLAHENVRRKLEARTILPTSTSKPSTTEAVQASNAKAVYDAPAKKEPEQQTRFVSPEPEDVLRAGVEIAQRIQADIDATLKPGHEKNALTATEQLMLDLVRASGHRRLAMTVDVFKGEIRWHVHAWDSKFALDDAGRTLTEAIDGMKRRKK